MPEDEQNEANKSSMDSFYNLTERGGRWAEVMLIIAIMIVMILAFSISEGALRDPYHFS